MFGVSGAAQGGSNGESGDSKGGFDMNSGITMGPVMDSSIVPGGPSKDDTGDPIDTKDGPGAPGSNQKPEPTGPSEADDSELIFDPNLFAKETGDNPFLDAKDGFLEGDADLFKEDREFKPAPPANANGQE